MIKPWIYKHYKWNLYQVIDIAIHSETLEQMVIYKALYETPHFKQWQLWVRPAKMFEEKVEIEGNSVARFEYIEGLC